MLAGLRESRNDIIEMPSSHASELVVPVCYRERIRKLVRKAIWVREQEARCVRTGEKDAVLKPSGKKTLSASRSTLSDTVPFFLGLLPCDTWQKRTQGHMPDLA